MRGMFSALEFSPGVILFAHLFHFVYKIDGVACSAAVVEGLQNRLNDRFLSSQSACSGFYVK